MTLSKFVKYNLEHITHDSDLGELKLKKPPPKPFLIWEVILSPFFENSLDRKKDQLSKWRNKLMKVKKRINEQEKIWFVEKKVPAFLRILWNSLAKKITK